MAAAPVLPGSPHQLIEKFGVGQVGEMVDVSGAAFTIVVDQIGQALYLSDLRDHGSAPVLPMQRQLGVAQRRGGGAQRRGGGAQLGGQLEKRVTVGAAGGGEGQLGDSNPVSPTQVRGGFGSRLGDHLGTVPKRSTQTSFDQPLRSKRLRSTCRSDKTLVMVWMKPDRNRFLAAWAISGIVMLPLSAACATVDHGTVIATSGVPSVSTAPPTQQKAVMS